MKLAPIEMPMTCAVVGKVDVGEANGGFASREPSAAGVVSKVVNTGRTCRLWRGVGRWGEPCA